MNPKNYNTRIRLEYGNIQDKVVFYVKELQGKSCNKKNDDAIFPFN